ncbi:putative DNA-binding ribbon-helix-helix protein [Methylorubrum zatmanii]|nr:putative DNA-binding ribbon-helix-helix protein [Methylorubrum zatmanii]MCP1554836.1 putative DNA-binding ribbon-helix-helix protein [Methylorubrum extorquens]MCP1578853.1 putative DNA-binding ribbon-helix-helix protein [Methylorubrum extorquens]
MIAGHRTSVSLEAEFWGALQEIAQGRGQSVQALIGAIDSERGARNLSSAIRVFVLHAMKDRSATVIAEGGDTSADPRLSPE